MYSKSFVPGLIGAIAFACSVLGNDEAGIMDLPSETDGFPNLAPAGSDNETDIFNRGFGTRPNSPPLTNLTDDDKTSFQLVSYTGIFEVIYFTQLTYNITNNISGYEIADADERDLVLRSMSGIIAQEEIHVLQANGVLEANGFEAIAPCKYITPVSDLKGAIFFAYLFTALLLGALQQVLLALGLNGAFPDIPIVASISEQEGEQVGFFRYYNKDIPSSNPFLTGATRAMAFNGVRQQVVVPDSCPNSDQIDPPYFDVLNVERDPDLTRSDNQTLQFYIEGDDTNVLSDKSICYIYQQNLPFTVPITESHVDNGYIYFLAEYPTGLLTFGKTGLIIVLLVNSTGPYETVNDVDPFVTHGPLLLSGN